jgi:hypothetical protein
MRKLRVVVVLLAVAGVVGWAVYRRIAHPPPDSSRLASAFASAPSATKLQIDQAVGAVESGRLADSVSTLKAVEAKGGISEDQRQAMLYTLTEIRRKVSERRGDHADLFNQIDELTLKLMGPPE